MRLRAAVKSLCFVLVAVVAFFALLEAVLWILGGFESRWVPPRVAGAGERTLICTGDSVTFGLGADTNQSYPAQLARLPAIRSRHIRVLNLGRPGQTMRDAVGALDGYLEANPMDSPIVILLAGFNDCAHLPGMFTESPAAARAEPLRDLLAYTRTYRLLRNLLARIREDSGRNSSSLPPVGTGHDDALCRNELSAGGLDRAVSAARTHAFHLFVTTYPIPLEAPRSNLPAITSRVNTLFREEAARRHVPLLDTVACIQSAEASTDEPFYNDDGIHLFARGYQAMAFCVASQLERYLDGDG